MWHVLFFPLVDYHSHHVQGLWSTVFLSRTVTRSSSALALMALNKKATMLKLQDSRLLRSLNLSTKRLGQDIRSKLSRTWLKIWTYRKDEKGRDRVALVQSSVKHSAQAESSLHLNFNW